MIRTHRGAALTGALTSTIVASLAVAGVEVQDQDRSISAAASAVGVEGGASEQASRSAPDAGPFDTSVSVSAIPPFQSAGSSAAASQDSTLTPLAITGVGGASFSACFDRCFDSGGSAQSTMTVQFSLLAVTDVQLSGMLAVSNVECCGNATSSFRLEGPGGVLIDSTALFADQPVDLSTSLTLGVGDWTLTVVADAGDASAGPSGGASFEFDLAFRLCVADLTGDGAVEGADLGILLSQWGGPGSADFDGNGTVDGADLGLLLSSWGPCAIPFYCGAPGSGTCCAPNGSPGCDNATCCEQVCAADSFCCEIEWDQVCADAAESCAVCTDPCGPGTGDCCAANGSPGCEVADCCEAICGADPFCCAVEWDQICADAADGACAQTCEACGDLDAGSCIEANGTPGCYDAFCCQKVCQVDASCCDSAWDASCATTAGLFCGFGACCLPDGPCVTETGGGCSVLGGAFQGILVPCDEFTCLDLGVCGEPDAGDCYVANGTPGCDDEACCVVVCEFMPSCCTIAWDESCVTSAEFDCPNTGACCLRDGSCFTTTPGLCAKLLGGEFQGFDTTCEDVSCTSPICTPGAGDCCTANGSPGCSDAACCASVCAVDSFCCDTEWDQICADAAILECAACTAECPPDSGNCCVANGTPGCEDADCCTEICAADSFCCDTEWDSICADAAVATCEVCN